MNIKLETEQYSRFFFDKMSTQLNKEISPPQIIFAPNRTADEDFEYNDLAIRSLSEEGLTPSQKERITTLNNKLGSWAGMDQSTGLIRIPEKNLNIPTLDILSIFLYKLTHEFLHHTREQTAPIPETFKGYDQMDSLIITLNSSHLAKNKAITLDAVTVEFFADMWPVVIETFCVNEEKYKTLLEIANNANTGIAKRSLNKLRTIHERVKNNPEKEFYDILNLYGPYKSKLFNTSDSDHQKLQIITERLQELSIYMNHVKRGYKELPKQSIWRQDKATRNMIFDKPSAKKLLFEWFKGNEYDFYDDYKKVYAQTTVAIGTALPQLKENWPQILLANGVQVEAQYITPVLQELEKMGEENNYIKRERKTHQQKIKKLESINTQQAYDDIHGTPSLIIKLDRYLTNLLRI
jgi:hypothetical protein